MGDEEDYCDDNEEEENGEVKKMEEVQEEGSEA